MASPKDLQIIPDRYQVLKMKNGQEIVGMTRDDGENIEVTLPMHCQLTPSKKMWGQTVAQFYPYIPMTGDLTVLIDKNEIMTVVALHDQFIPLYDNACVRWSTWVEEKKIPIIDKEPMPEDIAKMRDMVHELVENMSPEEFREMEEEEYFDEDYDDFTSAKKTKKTIIH